MTQKDILFYSNFCDFCKEMMTMIAKNDLSDKFMLVCVDNTKLKLPTFVDRVPLIYTTQKQLYSDENLVNYIKTKLSSSTSTLQPYALVGMGTGGLSDSFSFLNQEEDETGMRNFIFVGMDQKINAPDEGDNNGFGGKDGENMLERYMADRNADISKIFGNNKENRII
jgi:hypothetical protein